VQQRIAKAWRVGRVLLAGDAAHNNNPLGGMGLNSGLHDAVNLAGKLVAVLRGEAGGEALARYERQRRSVAVEHVNQMAARNKKLLEEREPAARRRGLDELARTAADPAAAHRFLLQSSLIASLRRAAEL
jgi:3-(3-hydroxy-phenyl)propionate hydroxylase